MSTSESRRELSALEEYWLDEVRAEQPESERKDRTVLMGKKHKKSVNTCTHWQDKINVGGYTVWVSGSAHRQSSKAPDVGVFMDWAWSDLLGQAVFPPLKESETGERDYYVDWSDRSVIKDSVFEEVVQFIAEQVRDGKQVEFGCVGGHGRTGTVLAGLIVELEGLSAKEAIKAARSRHCEKAIETSKQEDMIYKLCGEEVPSSAGRGSKGVGTTVSKVWTTGAYNDDDADLDDWFNGPTPTYPPVVKKDGAFICSACNHALYACTCKVAVSTPAEIAAQISTELSAGD